MFITTNKNHTISNFKKAIFYRFLDTFRGKIRWEKIFYITVFYQKLTHSYLQKY